MAGDDKTLTHLYAAARLALAAATAAACAPALAQTQQATRAYDIAAQPLSQALRQYMAQSGVQVGYMGADGAGTMSSPVKGTHSAGEALSILLGGTGLVHRFTGESTATLQRAPSPGGAVQLGPVRVEGTGLDRRTGRSGPETAWGPVDGPVAKRTATGSKTDTPIIEIPQSVSVVTADQIDSQAAQTLEQAVLYTAGVTVGSNGPSTEHDYAFARGFTAPQFLDGTRLYASYITGAQLRIEAYGLERIEILKGPSSGLYGQITPGGLVNMITKRPVDGMPQEVRFQAGSFNRFQGSFDVGGAATEDGALLFRLTGLIRESDTQSQYMEDNRRFIAPAVTWSPSDRTTLTLLAHYQSDEGGGRAQPLPPAGTIEPNPNGRVPLDRFMGEPAFDGLDREQYAIGYVFEHRFTEQLAARQSFRYAHARFHENFSYTDFFGQFLVDQRTVDRTAWDDRNMLELITLDNQLEGRFSTGPLEHHVVAGLDGRWVTDDWLFQSAPMGRLDVFQPVYGQPIGPFTTYISQRQKERHYGLYLQDQIAIGRFRLTLGGRHDWTRGTTDDLLFDARTVQKDTAFTGRVGVSWLFDNGLAPYASFSTSFEPVIGTDGQGQPFLPSRGRQWEAGLKYQPPGVDALVTVSLFELTQTNVLTSDPNPPPTNPWAQVQTGEIRVRGLEAEAKLSLADGLDLLASYSYLDSEITRSNAGDVGRPRTYTPRHQAAIWADYTIQAGTLAGVRAGLGGRYRGPMMGLYYDYRLPGQFLVDALLGFDLGQVSPSLEGVEISVNARNLADKKYITNCNVADGCIYGERRTVLGTLRYRW